MKIKTYYNYFKYIIEHKKNVFIECWKSGLYLHAFTHDLSKFKPSEFFPYAEHFYGEKDCRKCDKYSKCDYNQIGLGHSVFAKECSDYKYKDFENAWKSHYTRNKHHWNFWILQGTPIGIPNKYLKQMVADWSAMSKKFGDTPQQFYINNYHKINLHRDSRYQLELMLGLLDHYDAPFGEDAIEIHSTLYEVLQQAEKYYNNHGEIRLGTVKNNYNDLYKWICETYRIDLYEKLHK